MTINYNNYFEKTTGTFTNKGSLPSWQIYQARTSILDKTNLLSIINKKFSGTWEINYVSNKSIYFINKSKNSLIRLSPYWSNDCGRIRRCLWNLDTYKIENDKNYKWKIGKITFKNLKEIK